MQRPKDLASLPERPLRPRDRSGSLRISPGDNLERGHSLGGRRGEPLTYARFARTLQQKSRRRPRHSVHYDPTARARHEMLSGGKHVVLRIVTAADPEGAGQAGYPSALPRNGEARRRTRRELHLLRCKSAHPPNPPAMNQRSERVPERFG